MAASFSFCRTITLLDNSGRPRPAMSVLYSSVQWIFLYSLIFLQESYSFRSASSAQIRSSARILLTFQSRVKERCSWPDLKWDRWFTRLLEVYMARFVDQHFDVLCCSLFGEHLNARDFDGKTLTLYNYPCILISLIRNGPLRNPFYGFFINS